MIRPYRLHYSARRSIDGDPNLASKSRDWWRAVRWFLRTVVPATLLASTPALATITVQDGGTLSGAGNINGAVVVESGGRLVPGGVGATGCLSILQGLTLQSGAVAEFEFDGATDCTERDRLNVEGSLTIDDAVLSVTAAFTPVIGDSLTLAAFTGGSITSTTAIAGDTVNAGGVALSINLTGGDGNDLTLDYLAVPSKPVITGSDAQLDVVALTFDIANTGSSAVTNNIIRCESDGTVLQSNGSGSPLILTGLETLADWSCTVIAQNAAGASAVSRAVVVTPLPLPGLPVWLIYEATQ